MKQLASDVGGTFVDVVLWDSVTNEIQIDKLPSTRHSAEGILAAIAKVCAETATAPDDIARFVHGFTIATNAWLERRGGRVLLLTTAGFRDMLEIGTQRRLSLYSLRPVRARPLVPRAMTHEVAERIDAFGQVVTPLTDAEIARVVGVARQAAPDSVAITLLFAHANPVHEYRLAEALRAARPDIDVYVSAEINPQIEEYARANTTATAAYVGPAVRAYLGELEAGLAHLGIGSLMLMRSDGGIATPGATLRNPATVLLSGPAGGVIAAAAMGQAIGVADMVTFDMGGTSADFSLITGGRAGTSNERRIDNQPVRLPMIDIETISAGGGSIAAVDHAGALTIGPHSAGAIPGPACYGRGGMLPTLTDAILALGMIDPDDFAGGVLRLDPALADAAIARGVAAPLGLSVESAALGMIAVANAHMRQAIRALTIERGYDLRRYALAAFGGAGPIFAALMLPELGMAKVLVPPRPGVFAALGLLMSDIRHNLQSSLLMSLAALDSAMLQARLSAMADQLHAALDHDGVAPDARGLSFAADMRYIGQFHDLTIPLPAVLDPAALAKSFHAAHARVHGHADPQSEVEIVMLRAAGIGRVEKARLARLSAAAGETPGPRGVRPVQLPGMPAREPCPIYDRAALGPGHHLAGPAILSQSDSTIAILPGQTGRVDDWGVLHIAGTSTPQ